MSDRFRVVAIDRRGFGRSSAPPALEREIDDLLAVREALGLERIALVGSSQGARIALHFAAAHPGLLSAIVLDGAPLDGFQPEEHGEEAIPLARYAELAGSGRLGEMKSLWRDHAMMQGAPASAQPLLDQILDDYEARDLLAGSARSLGAIAGALGTIRVPALVITGGGDTAWRRLVGDAIAYGLPDARRATIAGGRHLCNLSHPDEYDRLIADFLGDLTAGATQRQN